MSLNSTSMFLSCSKLVSELVRFAPEFGAPGQVAVQRYLADRLASLGFTVKIQDFYGRDLVGRQGFFDVEGFGGVFSGYNNRKRVNVSAERYFSADGPHILLNGHSDVEFVNARLMWKAAGLWAEGKQVGDRIYGRGSSDMLGGCAAILSTLQDLYDVMQKKATGRLTVHFVVDEEIGGNGTLAALQTLSDTPDLAIIAEPTAYHACLSARGFEQVELICHGVPKHMCGAEPWDNANFVAAQVIDCIETVEARNWPTLVGRTLMYGAIQGGLDSATPSEKTRIGLCIARPPSVSHDTILHMLRNEMKSRRFGHKTCFERVDVRPCAAGFAPFICHRPAQFQRFFDTIDSGRHAYCQGLFESGCDARLLEDHQIPTLICGPGDLKRAHGPNEYVTTQELKDYCMLLKSFLDGVWSAGSLT